MRRNLLRIAIVLLTGVSTLPDMRGQTTFKVLHSFSPVSSDGIAPSGALIRDSSGALYGTASEGGELTNCYQLTGCGIVFTMDPSGRETVLYRFAGHSDGAGPRGTLARDEQGNIYGDTAYGGSSGCSYGCGTVFKVDPSGKETVLHRFTSDPDGASPFAGLIRDKAGNLYGTTFYGGDATLCTFGCGTVFKLDATGNETVLYRFAGGANGAHPAAELMRDEAGNLYGTTIYGGNTTCGTGSGCGIVFKVDSNGNETQLYKFVGGVDGEFPTASLIRDSLGNLCGTASEGGVGGYGTIFKLDPSGAFSVIYSFTGGIDGGTPAAGLIADSAGNMYGTTAAGGSGYGVVFKIDNTGNETVLHAFLGGSDGANPVVGLVRDATGNLFGTTLDGGARTYGTVFKLTH